MNKPSRVRQQHPQLFVRANKQTGFSLLEVLISVAVLSFGLLGMVGLQAAALQGNRDARLQSTAVQLARELAEMMRGNKDIALLAGAANPYLRDFSSPLTAASPNYCLSVSSAACGNPTEVANAQMTEWLARVDAELPGAQVGVCIDSAPYDATGKPRWACATTGTDATTVIKLGWTRATTDRSQTGAAAVQKANIAPLIVFPITAGNTL